MIEVKRLSDDGLTARIWRFDFNGRCLRLTEYMEGERDTARKKFRGPRWDWMDERAYNSQLPRPTSIPDDVVDEAMRHIVIDVAIGWTHPDHVIDRRRAA